MKTLFEDSLLEIYLDVVGGYNACVDSDRRSYFYGMVTSRELFGGKMLSDIQLTDEDKSWAFDNSTYFWLQFSEFDVLTYGMLTI